jgi:pimeloyl-ACP methyl ester carboxylesterase
MRTTTNHDIELAYETFGDSPGRPLLLIQGAGAPMLGWPDEFCAALVASGFHVARFDNRDAGRSSRATTRYTLADMAGDGLAVMDALGWPAAHVVGFSLGGMIAQVMAARHPDRVLSLTSMCSAPDHFFRWDWRKVRIVARYLTLRRPRDADEAGEQLLRLHRIIGSTGYPHDVDWIRTVGRRAYEHRSDAAAFRRQALATRVSGDRRAELANVRARTLVISGEADPAQPPRAGRATAAAIPGARFVSFAGMGHDLPRGLWPAFVEEIDAIARG